MSHASDVLVDFHDANCSIEVSGAELTFANYKAVSFSQLVPKFRLNLGQFVDPVCVELKRHFEGSFCPLLITAYLIKNLDL